MNIIEFHRMDQNNPGDLFSNPSRYFDFNLKTYTIDIDSVRKTVWKIDDALIVGGGGLVGHPNFDLLMKRLSVHPDEQILKDFLSIGIKTASPENKSLIYEWKEIVQKETVKILSQLDKKIGPRILWGVGHNSRENDIDSYSVVYPDYLKEFHLVGIRDYDSDYRWVPCSSCMHPNFSNEYPIKNKVVWFEHKKRLIDNKHFDRYPAPRMVNTGQNIEQILEFLGSAETVVTNSYHGAYWATLLKRKVVCVPWGSKFNMFKHPPIMASDRDWETKIDDAKEYPNALEECREANVKFAEDVRNLLKEMS